MKINRIQIGEKVFPVETTDTVDLQLFGCRCTKHNMQMEYFAPKDGYYPECRCPVEGCGRKVIKLPDGNLFYCFESIIEAHEYEMECLEPTVDK